MLRLPCMVIHIVRPSVRSLDASTGVAAPSRRRKRTARTSINYALCALSNPRTSQNTRHSLLSPAREIAALAGVAVRDAVLLHDLSHRNSQRRSIKPAAAQCRHAPFYDVRATQMGRRMLGVAARNIAQFSEPSFFPTNCDRLSR